MARPRAHAFHRRRKRRFMESRLAYSLEVIACVGALVWFGNEFYVYIRTSPDFQVRKVKIEGTEALARQTVLEHAGITKKDNVFFFDTRGTMARVEAMPYIRACSIERTFPDTVILTVEERKPVATLIVHSRAYEIDANGIVLRQYAPGELPLAPFFTNVGGLEFVELGEQRKEPAFLAAFEVWRAFSATTLPESLTISELSAPHKDDIRMYCDEIPYEIRWGRGNFYEQAQRFEILWNEKDGDLPCTEYLDLRFGEYLACK